MRWATFITKNSETIKHIKEKKELIVEENRRNQLGAKLKEMIKHFDQAEAKRKEPITQSGTGNGIRRREGEKDKRFSV
jgi:Asp-tRNA(Asn)/Glu-tRNA(Gln) amidotransferase C subunit